MIFVKVQPREERIMNNFRIIFVACFVALVVMSGQESGTALANSQSPFEIQIEKAHNVMPGHLTTVDIKFNGGTYEMAGFDFLISFDEKVLSFVDADAGEFFNRCGWGLYSYRYNDVDGSMANVSTGYIRLIGSANAENADDPECFLPTAGETLVSMIFKMTAGCKHRCQSVPLRFYWNDCSDNTILLRSGNTLAMSRMVYDHNGTVLTQTKYELPGIFGAPNNCFEGGPPDQTRLIDFYSGGFDMVCSDEICLERGDINCNMVSYEIADAVEFISYFVLHFWSPPRPPCFSKNSDINNDGILLSVADLVYLVRVIIGEATPYPKMLPPSDRLNIASERGGDEIKLWYDSPVDVRGISLSFKIDGTAGIPNLGSSVEDMDLKYDSNGDQMSVLIYNIGPNSMPAGNHMLLSIPVEGSLRLVEADAADYFGRILDVDNRVLPDRFRISQNRPNPFNPETEIELTFPVESDWQLVIYNVAGQLIREYSGSHPAGSFNVIWDGRDESGNLVSSGIYLYNVTAADHSITKKMILLK
jgi:hypothetical protein